MLWSCASLWASFLHCKVKGAVGHNQELKRKQKCAEENTIFKLNNLLPFLRFSAIEKGCILQPLVIERQDGFPEPIPENMP